MNRSQPIRGDADDEALREIWQLVQVHHRDLYYRSLRLMNGHQQDAEDALSLATIRAAQKYPLFAGDIGDARAWLYRLLFNACMDMHRMRARSKRLDVVLLPSPEMADLAESIVARVLVAEVEVAIAGLPHGLRQPLVMRCVLDMSYEEIARRTGLTYANARKRVQLARAQLRVLLDTSGY